MERRAFGSTGMSVSLLGFGGAEIGYGGASVELVEQVIGQALDSGLNVIDTAECYNDSESLIGRAVGSRRREFFLFTKCGHAMNRPGEEAIDGGDWEPKQLEQSIDRSLKRLRTDCLDLVQLHTCGRELLEQGDVIDVVLRAKEAGKTRFVGYSGDSHAARYAVECGAFDALQTSCSIADQEAIDLTLPLAAEKGMGVVIKRPLANAAWLRMEDAEGKYWEEYVRRLKLIGYEWLEGSDAASIALRFTSACPGVSTMIVGTQKPGRWQENAALLEAGPLGGARFESIRAAWKAAAQADWVGQG